MDKDGLSDFLIDYRDNSEWHDNTSFSNLIDKFYEIYNNFTKEKFYVLNIDWFGSLKEALASPKNIDYRMKLGNWMMYDYFILLIWFDPDGNTLTVSEWLYD